MDQDINIRNSDNYVDINGKPVKRVVHVDPSGNLVNPATSDKQLPDNHRVTVSNPTANPETGLAKDLTLKDGNQKSYDEGNNLLLREILDQLNIPLWLDMANNALRTSIVTTIGTLTTLTNQSQIGGITADPVVPSLLNDVWANSVRSLLI